MINPGSESNLEIELKDFHNQMIKVLNEKEHNEKRIKNLMEETIVLQNEIQRLHNEKLVLTDQLKYIKKITEQY